LDVATQSIGLMLVEKEIYEEAVEYYKKSLQYKPKNPLYWVNLGKAY
jgi:tetratricopeptide (TPR) repeat protein